MSNPNNNKNIRKDVDYSLFNDYNTTLLVNQNMEKNNEDDINTLISMGFNQKMAKKIYVLMRPNNIDEAIYLLTEDNGKYHHYFVERHGKSDECFICGLGQERHINFLPEERQRKNSIFNKIKDKNTGDTVESEMMNMNEPLIEPEDDANNDKDDETIEKKDCSICDGQLTGKEMKRNYLSCEHYFCSECYLNYLKEKIESNQVGFIKCMQKECNKELDKNFITWQLSGDKELLEKYCKFKKRYEIYTDQNLILCPNEFCESYAKKDENNQFVQCLNGHKFCSLCRNPWHKNKKCKIEDGDYKKRFHLKNCPKCGSVTEKNMGCNHMKCHCGCNWCWFCGEPFEDEYIHFGVNGPCADLQFTRNDLFNNCCCLYLYKFWIGLMHCILLIFIIPSIITAFYLRDIKSDLRDEQFQKLKIPCYIIAIIYTLAYFGLYASSGFPVFLIFIVIPPLKRKAIRYMLDLDDRES